MSASPVQAGLDRDDYALFCAGVRRLCCVDLTQYRRNQMERRIRSLAEKRGMPQLSSYLATLCTDEDELDRSLDRMTINVSQLWRNPDQWALLGEEIVPQLVRDGQLRAWSAGCSYGAEVFTLAAVCLDALPSIKLEILGSDIDARMIERARRAEFSDSDARNAPREGLERWFERTANGWRAGAELRAVARFEVADLLAARPRGAPYDLIVCRNTVIYLTPHGRGALYEGLVEALRPGGYLMVGCTERIHEPEAYGLTLAHSFTYRKA
jgi:chemotaxis protein methyltransferase CheR